MLKHATQMNQSTTYFNRGGGLASTSYGVLSSAWSLEGWSTSWIDANPRNGHGVWAEEVPECLLKLMNDVPGIVH